MSWITLKTTNARWEAELMQQVLAAHDIPSRIVDAGIASYFGACSPAALQVLSHDQWTALLLLSSPEEEQAGASDNN
ncbi:MAG: DUF2007 domain-containing protein [Symplocastrum torsivum CPER-KK1]|uniref:DUF2007 domain-containing protein n=1 Tax=Symplocastrum torsivum CPER-KK1 TaxID=450513 RepID=A0A951PLF1_9CYAN|nr:hypothetical protein [Microcoleus sp. FACHB-SPT15]MBD1807980.1 hypothetical protein [Microcoleus sp. FACHB-SPT15]MBW4545751.1 DUF2007 domain-containing protein [Symplocastrum torsivum CPER-KK1]NEQ20612.1 DUF2007 domain-containing protein [Microcoleus sp. SIO2G3]